MDYAPWILLLRIIILFAVSLDLFVLLSPCKNQIIYEKKTKLWKEFIKNYHNILSFSTAFLILILVDDIRESRPVYNLFMDILIIGLLNTIFVVPKSYRFTEKGVYIHGFFHKWGNFKGFIIDKKRNIIKLRRGGIFFIFRESLPLDDKILKILKSNLKGNIS